MSLRPATIDDLPAIMDLERRSFPTDAWSEQTMGTEITSDHNIYLVEEQGGAVIGYGGVRALRGGSDADIQTIALDPDWRGRGIGRELLRALIAAARYRGAREVFLEVRADNPSAEGLYLAEGFVEFGRRPRYYQPDDVDAIVMRLDLRAREAGLPHASPAAPASPAPPAALTAEENTLSGGEPAAEHPLRGENSSHPGEDAG